jgi:hypothetical protein
VNTFRLIATVAAYAIAVLACAPPATSASSAETRSVYYSGSVEGVSESEVTLKIRQVRSGRDQWKSFRARLVAKFIPEVCSDGTSLTSHAGGQAAFTSRHEFFGERWREAPDSNFFYHRVEGRAGKAAAHGTVATDERLSDPREPECATDGALTWRAERVKGPLGGSSETRFPHNHAGV